MLRLALTHIDPNTKEFSQVQVWCYAFEMRNNVVKCLQFDDGGGDTQVAEFTLSSNEELHGIEE